VFLLQKSLPRSFNASTIFIFSFKPAYHSAPILSVLEGLLCWLADVSGNPASPLNINPKKREVLSCIEKAKGFAVMNVSGFPVNK
jgi:hypothetical protein